jgi:hypothetical protein
MAKAAGSGSGDHHPATAGDFFAGLMRAIPISVVLWGGIAWLFGVRVMVLAVLVMCGVVGTIAIWGIVGNRGSHGNRMKGGR